MKLELRRKWATDNSTIGELYIDGVYFCYTLEDVVRPQKIKKETAIPNGTYRVEVDLSPKYGKLMPHVMNVPGFEGIRIHPGNDKEDTEGCILVGKTRATDRIFESRATFEVLFPLLKGAGDISITITNDFEHPHPPVEGTDI